MNQRKSFLPTTFLETVNQLRPYNDVFVGLDDMLRSMNVHLGLLHPQLQVNYPPHNLVETQDGFTIQLAVAGFGPENMNVALEKSQDNTSVLRISGKIESKTDGSVVAKNIATRQFSREFLLADGLEVADVSLKHGLLTIEISKPQPKVEEPKVKQLTINVE